MYRGYWPNAIVMDNRRKVIRLFTYDACDTLNRARRVINDWNKTYEGCIVASYIEHSWDKKRVCCKFYEDRLRKLEYGLYSF